MTQATSPSKFLFRLRYEVRGGHTRVSVFAGKGSLSLYKCGELVFYNEEWEEFQKNLFRFMLPGSDIEVLKEKEPE